MMKLTAMLCSAAITVGSLTAPVGPAVALPMPTMKMEVPAANVEQVRLRRYHRFYRGGPRFYRRGFHRPYRYRSDFWVPGAFMAGAIIGGAILAPRYRYHAPYRRYYRPYYCNNWRQDCW